MWAAFLFAGAFAVADWVAVERANKALEYVAKPATMVALVAAALALDPADSGQRAWFVAALILSLAGDVFLMLPRDLFVAGLASFLLGHLAYIAGFVARGLDGPNAVLGAIAIAIIGSALVRPILHGVRAREPQLAAPVVAYMVVISGMVASARGAGVALAAIGALAFYCSDALIAWNRFVRSQRHGALAIIVTYHVAQVLLTASLVTT